MAEIVDAVELERRRDLLRKFAANDRSDGLMEEIFHLDYVHNDPLLPPGHHVGVNGRERYRSGMEQNRVAFPDAEMTQPALLADGEFTARRYTFRGTRTGPLMGQAPTGQYIEYWGLNLYRWENGKVVEGWTLFSRPDKYDPPEETAGQEARQEG